MPLSKPGGGSSEPPQVNSEKLPDGTEPTLASDQDIDEVVNLRPRQPKGKPKMRVDAAQLRDSGLLKSLPEFINKLASANLEAETQPANGPLGGAGFELDDEEAAAQPHIEMDLVTGLFESQGAEELGELKLPGNEPARDSSSSSASSSSQPSSNSGSDADSPAPVLDSRSNAVQKRKVDAISSSSTSSSSSSSSGDSSDDTESSSPRKVRIVTKKRTQSSGGRPPHTTSEVRKKTTAGGHRSVSSPDRGSNNSGSSSSTASRIIRVKVPKISSASPSTGGAGCPSSSEGERRKPSPIKKIKLVKREELKEKPA